MSENPTIDKNAPLSIETLYSSSGLSYWPVILFLPARLLFAFIAQGFTASLFFNNGPTNAWLAAAAWWPVYSTITDVLCLLSLIWLTRREDMTIIDLLGARGKTALKQFAWTPAYLLAVLPGAILAHLITTAFYGSTLPPMITIVNLPPLGVFYFLLIWPVIWVIAEELVYLGYLLPRIEVLSGSTWIAVLVVIFFWGFQHFAIPFIPDEKYLVSRVLAAFAAIGAFTIVFVLWKRRLIPLIGAHYVADLSTAIIAGLLPFLNSL